MGSVWEAPTPASPFTEALSEFVAGFGKKKRPSFVQGYLDGFVVTSNDVQMILEGMEKKSAHRQTRRLLEPVIQAMVDYSGVLDTLCTPDQMAMQSIGLSLTPNCRSSRSNAHRAGLGVSKSVR